MIDPKLAGASDAITHPNPNAADDHLMTNNHRQTYSSLFHTDTNREAAPGIIETIITD